MSWMQKSTAWLFFFCIFGRVQVASFQKSVFVINSGSGVINVSRMSYCYSVFRHNIRVHMSDSTTIWRFPFGPKYLHMLIYGSLSFEVLIAWCTLSFTLLMILAFVARCNSAHSSWEFELTNVYWAFSWYYKFSTSLVQDFQPILLQDYIGQDL